MSINFLSRIIFPININSFTIIFFRFCFFNISLFFLCFFTFQKILNRKFISEITLKSSFFLFLHLIVSYIIISNFSKLYR